MFKRLFCRRGRSGFTLVELLVVIAIIGILVALLLPAIQAAREAARRTQCNNNLKNFGLGLQNYHDAYKTFPIAGANWGRPNIGWQVQVLPFMEEAALWDEVSSKGSAANIPYYDVVLTTTGLPARRTQVSYTRCPSDPADDFLDPNWAQSSYSGSLGSQRTPSASGSCNTYMTPGVHYENPGGTADHGNTTDKNNISGMFGRLLFQSIAMRDVLDGTSSTIFVGEILPDCNDHRTGWWNYNGMGNAHASTSSPINELTTCPRSPKITNPACTNPNNWNYSWGFRSYHPGGAQLLFVDGSVHFLTEDMDYETYQRLGGRRDGEAVADF